MTTVITKILLISMLICSLIVCATYSSAVRINHHQQSTTVKPSSYQKRGGSSPSSSSSSTDSYSSSDSGSSADEPGIKEYLELRQKLVDQENKIKDGSFIHLNDNEIKANQIFSQILQYEELSLSNNDPSGINFLQAINNISETQVYQIIKKMPKGSILHLHQDSSATYDYLISVGTYMPNCYLYVGQNNAATPFGSFYFYAQQPSDPNWKLVATLRSQASNVTEFDATLLGSLTLFGLDYGNYISLWDKFDVIFARVAGLVTYTPITMGYMSHLVNQTFEDNVQHLELRKCFGSFYDLSGTAYNNTWFMTQLAELVEQVRVDYNAPEFAIKIIGCDGRHSSREVVFEHMKESLELRNQFPETFIGYDLVGPEDEGYPLIYFLEEFAELQEMSKYTQYPLEYYFHAGETILYNNTNLYDAILLKSVRIGHGLQLTKHPLLMDLVKQNNIGIEVCPISNQVLEFVANFRAHPAFALFNEGLPITINNDDPAIYGYSGISFDFYEVTVGWGLNIQQLKQLAINSLAYSTYFDDQEKNATITAWESKWEDFINWLITLTPPTFNK
ncbi:adenosine deaminase-related growth factor [Cavenderia fasciculata]|uniref:adenosine deaminase n=1 Tax=Cavenderia fasciculata TaxID=261658 RepID=F4PNZ1_CACFS|nr:adenosine deaminase-related growth factor [Cavenderia fasciculata]EGG22670.1 adenosine deaminase-related growth factor [Cavenderia fasciculata]|eukprot:XP_004360521.1 adenosine deaminase-related growth factor [Cavenderia fasciculata]